MPDRFVEEAVERAHAVRAVVEKHRGELLPHMLVLIRAVGEVSARACVYGAFEAAAEVSRKAAAEDGVVVLWKEGRDG